MRALVLVGPHGSGKTTLGRRVAAALGWRFQAEIGEELRREALARDPGAHALLAQDAFDTAVFERELARDARLVGGTGRVVETWHPGNLAYAERRSAGVARSYATRLRAAAQRQGALVQPLALSAEAARRRLREPGPSPERLVAWFQAVGDRARRLAEEWGLPVLPVLHTDRLTEEEATQAVVRRALLAWRLWPSRGGAPGTTI